MRYYGVMGFRLCRSIKRMLGHTRGVAWRCGLAVAIFNTLSFGLLGCDHADTSRQHDQHDQHDETSSAVGKAISINDGWQIVLERDVITQVKTKHLVKFLSSLSDSNEIVEISLTCASASGFISASIQSNPSNYVWQQSPGDFLVKGLLRAAGAGSNPTSTLVQWRLGTSMHKNFISAGEFGNVAKIGNFLNLQSEPWIGTFAVAVQTVNGPVAVETQTNEPVASKFYNDCKEEAVAAKAAQEANAKAAHNQAIGRAAIVQRRQDLHSQSENFGADWDKYISEYSRLFFFFSKLYDIQEEWPEGFSCSVLVTQNRDDLLTSVKVIACNNKKIAAILDRAQFHTMAPLIEPPDASLFEPELVLKFDPHNL